MPPFAPPPPPPPPKCNPATLSPPLKLPYVLKGIWKLLPQNTRLQRLPITSTLLQDIHSLWSKQPLTFDRVMLWAALCTGFIGFMRAGEFTADCLAEQPHLSTTDVSVDSHENPQIVTLHSRRSKTDQFSRGTHIYLGRTHGIPCPVAGRLL